MSIECTALRAFAIIQDYKIGSAFMPLQKDAATDVQVLRIICLKILEDTIEVGIGRMITTQP